MNDLAKELVHTAYKAIFDVNEEPESMEEAQASVVAVLEKLAEVAPGTPEYAVEFDFQGMADEIQGMVSDGRNLADH